MTTTIRRRKTHPRKARNGGRPARRPLSKAPTGTAGLDEITNGGLPRGRPTLVCGGAGCGKTLLATEFLVRGALEYGEPGVFFSIEETTKELVTKPYRVLFDQMNEGAVTLTSHGMIVHCNRRFAEIVQTPLARVIGMPLRRFVSPADAATLEAMRKAATRESTRGDVQFRAGDGSLVPVAVSFAPLHQEGSADVNGVVGVVTDITERRRAEAERARLVERMITAQEEERRRIARELHDEIGQSLTALLVGLRSIESSPTVERAVELAQQLRETTAQTLDEVGRLWQGLHPGVLDDLGLAAAVTRLAQEFARLHGITVDVRTEGLEADGLSALLRATVYRVVQEALTNVAQHARARAAIVWLSRDARTVQLRVQDDGAGFQPGNGRRLGLRGMRERAALLGGSIEVESQPRAGTTIIAQFPVRDE